MINACRESLRCYLTYDVVKHKAVRAPRWQPLVPDFQWKPLDILISAATIMVAARNAWSWIHWPVLICHQSKQALAFLFLLIILIKSLAPQSQEIDS